MNYELNYEKRFCVAQFMRESVILRDAVGGH